jgi:hypothetical protein
MAHKTCDMAAMTGQFRSKDAFHLGQVGANGRGKGLSVGGGTVNGRMQRGHSGPSGQEL